MNLRTLIMTAAVIAALPSWGQEGTSHQASMLNAKNLTITTKQNTTYYYLITTDHSPVLHFGDGNVVVQNDEFALENITKMRLRSLSRFILDEDSTTFDKRKSVDHGLLALRRSLTVGKWNSLVLPVNLTTEQVEYAFGEGTELATPRGIRENDVTVVEFETVELTPGEVVVKAGYHYLIRPTRAADLAADSWTSALVSGQRINGPIYYIPNVSTTTSKAPRAQLLMSEDDVVNVYFRGSYVKLDGSSTSNKLIAAGTYMLSDEGIMVKNQDATEVKAFSSWLEDISDEKQPQLHFYVDGVGEDISEIVDALPVVAVQEKDDAVFDLGGRRVGSVRERASLKPGIYVIGGRKVVVK